MPQGAATVDPRLTKDNNAIPLVLDYCPFTQVVVGRVVYNSLVASRVDCMLHGGVWLLASHTLESMRCALDTCVKPRLHCTAKPGIKRELYFSNCTCGRPCKTNCRILGVS